MDGLVLIKGVPHLLGDLLQVQVLAIDLAADQGSLRLTEGDALGQKLRGQTRRRTLSPSRPEVLPSRDRALRCSFG